MNYKYKIALSFAMPEQEIVETVYHYLKSKGITVFFAPTAEAQVELSGRNQREVFFDVFSNQSEYVALFVSQNYIKRKVTPGPVITQIGKPFLILKSILVTGGGQAAIDGTIPNTTYYIQSWLHPDDTSGSLGELYEEIEDNG